MKDVDYSSRSPESKTAGEEPRGSDRTPFRCHRLRVLSLILITLEQFDRRAPLVRASSTSSRISVRSEALVKRPRPPRSRGLFFAISARPQLRLMPFPFAGGLVPEF